MKHTILNASHKHKCPTTSNICMTNWKMFVTSEDRTRDRHRNTRRQTDPLVSMKQKLFSFNMSNIVQTDCQLQLQSKEYISSPARRPRCRCTARAARGCRPWPARTGCAPRWPPAQPRRPGASGASTVCSLGPTLHKTLIESSRNTYWVYVGDDYKAY